MDAIFNNALDRAIELDDKILLLYFEREVDRNERRRMGGKKGGRPIRKLLTKPKVSKRKEPKENIIYNIFNNSSRLIPQTTKKQIIDKLNAEYEDIMPFWFENADSSVFVHKNELAELLAKYISLDQINGDIFCKCLQKWDYIARSQNKGRYLQKIFKENTK